MKNFLAMIVFAVFLMLGCGGGEGGGTASGVKEIYGVAAIGAPVAGSVNIKGADGKLSTSIIQEDGSYIVDVSALKSPFIIYVTGTVGSESIRLYSTIEIPGRANVTPASHLVMTLALGDDPEAVYPPADVLNPDKIIDDAPDASEIDAAKKIIQDILKKVFDTLDVPDTFDIMNGTFSADGSGFDKLLEAVRMDVDTTSGSVVIQISDSVTGASFYTSDADGSNIIDNTASMQTVVASASSDIDKIKKWFDDGIQSYMDTTSDEATFKINMGKVYADDYLEDGKDKAAAVQQDFEERGTITNLTIKNMVILEAFQNYNFAGATVTNPPNLPAGDYTFNTASAVGLGDNYKAVIVACVLEYYVDGVKQIDNDVIYLVQKTEGGEWKEWGNRSLKENLFYFGTAATKSVRPTGTTKYSGYSLWCPNTNNELFIEYGINAFLILGEGITAEYAPGKKGILLMQRNLPETKFTVSNVDILNYNEIYAEVSGLNIAAITNPELTIIGLEYNSGSKTFTPKHFFKTNTGNGIPISVSSSDFDNNFANYNYTSTDLANSSYSGASAIPWVLPWTHTVSWAAAVKTNMTFGSISFWRFGYPESTIAPENPDTTAWLTESKYWGEGDTSDNSLSFSIQNADTLIYQVQSMLFILSYYDTNGRIFETHYQISR